VIDHLAQGRFDLAQQVYKQEPWAHDLMESVVACWAMHALPHEGGFDDQPRRWRQTAVLFSEALAFKTFLPSCGLMMGEEGGAPPMIDE